MPSPHVHAPRSNIHDKITPPRNRDNTILLALTGTGTLSREMYPRSATRSHRAGADGGHRYSDHRSLHSGGSHRNSKSTGTGACSDHSHMKCHGIACDKCTPGISRTAAHLWGVPIVCSWVHFLDDKAEADAHTSTCCCRLTCLLDHVLGTLKKNARGHGS